MFSTLIKACSEALGVLVSPSGGLNHLGLAPGSFVPKAKVSSFETRASGTKSAFDLALMGIPGPRAGMWAKSYRDAVERQATLVQPGAVESVIEHPPRELEVKSMPPTSEVKMVERVVFGPDRPPISQPLVIDYFSPPFLRFLQHHKEIPRGIWTSPNTCRDLILVRQPVASGIPYNDALSISGAINHNSLDFLCNGFDIAPPFVQILQSCHLRPQMLTQPLTSEVYLPNNNNTVFAEDSINTCRALVVYQPAYRPVLVEETPLVVTALDLLLQRFMRGVFTQPRLCYIPSVLAVAMEPGQPVIEQKDPRSLVLMLAFKVISYNKGNNLQGPADEHSTGYIADGPIFSTSASFHCLPCESGQFVEQDVTLPRSVSYNDFQLCMAATEDLSSLIFSVLNIKMPGTDWFEEVESTNFAKGDEVTEQTSGGPSSGSFEPLNGENECSTPAAPEPCVMALVMGYINSTGPPLGVVVSVTPSKTSLQLEENTQQSKTDPAIAFAPPLSSMTPCVAEASSTSTTESQQDCVELEGQGAGLPLSLKEETPEPESLARRRPRFDRGGGALFRNAIGGIKKVNGSRRVSV
ncbi:hypothetical protein HGRIS_003719 [Hohenbuehelia grisea]|uniref:Uncharacterized protein n=1 Tax=Hohenbuehelia grisea TaxID=104357 RepID=A0ABR3JGB0_9AGAR